MANKFIYGVDEFSEAQSPVNGDSFDMAYDEAAHQAAANRTHFLNQRRKAAPTGSVADAYAGIEAAFTGDTNWHDSTVVTKTLAGAVGDVVPLFIVVSTLENSTPGQGTIFRVKIVDNGVTSYLDGGAEFVAADGTTHRVVLFGKHTMASAGAVITLQVKQTAAGVSATLAGGWNIMSL